MRDAAHKCVNAEIHPAVQQEVKTFPQEETLLELRSTFILLFCRKLKLLLLFDEEESLRRETQSADIISTETGSTLWVFL